MRPKLLLPITLLATGAILALVFTVSNKPAVYSVGVSQYLHRGMWDQTVRVRGTLVHGTLCRLDADCGYREWLRRAAVGGSVGRSALAGAA